MQKLKENESIEVLIVDADIDYFTLKDIETVVAKFKLENAVPDNFKFRFVQRSDLGDHPHMLYAIYKGI